MFSSGLRPAQPATYKFVISIVLGNVYTRLYNVVYSRVYNVVYSKVYIGNYSVKFVLGYNLQETDRGLFLREKISSANIFDR